MLNTILFDLDGTLAPFQQDEFVRVYFGLLVRRLVPMGYDGEKLVRALWKGVDAMIGNSGAVTNRQVFWECFTQEMGMQALALETILDDFYATDFDGARSCLTARTDRSGLIRSLRRRGYGVVLATINHGFPSEHRKDNYPTAIHVGQNVRSEERPQQAQPRLLPGHPVPPGAAGGGVPHGGQQPCGRHGRPPGGPGGLSGD